MIFKKKSFGFSLIELLVVIGIIAVLMTVVMASISRSKAKTRDTVRAEDLKTLHQTVEAFIVENGKLPANMTEITNFFKVNIKDPKKSPARNYLYGVFTDAGGTKYYCLGTWMELKRMSLKPCAISIGYNANYTIKGP